MPKNIPNKTPKTVQEDLTGTAFDLTGVPSAAPYPDKNPVEDPNGVARDMTDINMPAAMLAGMVNKFSNLTHSQMVDMYRMVMNQFGPNAAPGEPDDKAAAMNQATIQARGNPLDGLKEFTREQIEAVFANDKTLTEEFKNQATVLFEASISAAIATKNFELQENFEQRLVEEVSTIREELTNSVEDYLKYACEEWVNSNRLAIEEGARTDAVRNFVNKMRTVFTESNILLPETDIDALTVAEDKIKTLEAERDRLITENAQLNNNRVSKNFNTIFEEITTGMSVAEVARMQQLTEAFNTTCKSDAEFRRKVGLIRESYFTAVPGTQVIEEDAGVPSGEALDDPASNDPFVRGGAEFIRRTVRA